VKAEGKVRMQIAYLWSVALQTGQSPGAEVYLVHAAVGLFAAVLVLLSLYAWSRRRHVGLLLVSSAFLLFSLKEVIWMLSEMYSFSSSADLIRTLLDLVVLGLFFVAITLRPRKQLE
jgi:small-conductance mechanosensitive channel